MNHILPPGGGGMMGRCLKDVIYTVLITLFVALFGAISSLLRIIRTSCLINFGQ